MLTSKMFTFIDYLGFSINVNSFLLKIRTYLKASFSKAEDQKWDPTLRSMMGSVAGRRNISRSPTWATCSEAIALTSDYILVNDCFTWFVATTKGLDYVFLFISFYSMWVSRPKTSSTISLHLKGQLGPRVSNDRVFVCLSVTKNKHFLKSSVCLFVMMVMMVMKGNRTNFEIQIHEICETNPNAFQK